MKMAFIQGVQQRSNRRDDALPFCLEQNANGPYDRNPKPLRNHACLAVIQDDSIFPFESQRDCFRFAGIDKQFQGGDGSTVGRRTDSQPFGM